MSATQPFTVGLVQEAVGPDVAVNLNDAIAKIREAHARGAQIICLQELFNCQYFCKAQKGERFELAEPIPGPTITTMQALAKDLAVVLIVPIFERQAAGVYRNSAAVIDADGSLMGCIGRCTSRMTRSSTRSTTSCRVTRPPMTGSMPSAMSRSRRAGFAFGKRNSPTSVS